MKLENIRWKFEIGGNYQKMPKRTRMAKAAAQNYSSKVKYPIRKEISFFVEVFFLQFQLAQITQ